MNIDQDGNSGDKPVSAPKKEKYFERVIVDNTDNPQNLDLAGVRNAPKLPESMLALWRDIKATEQVVVTLFADDPGRRKEFFKGLYFAATAGLVGDNHDLDIGWSNLQEAKSKIAHEFPEVRNRYWRKYFITLVFMIIVFLPLGGACYYLSINGSWNLPKPDAKGVFDPLVVGLIAFLWIPVGASFGIFLEFIFGVGDNVSFEKLVAINPGRWHPFQQLMNTIFTSWVFAFVMAVNLFQIGLAAVLLNEFASTKPYLSLAVGFVTGFSFPYVRDIIYKLKPATKGSGAP